MDIDKSILTKAASELQQDVGSLRDLPPRLRETIASLYYEHWWVRLSLEPTTGHSSWTEHAVTRMGLYGMVPELVKSMREIREENESIFEMTLGAMLDLLRYNLKDVTRKSAVRRAMEKSLGKPFVEVRGVYALIEETWADSAVEEPVVTKVGRDSTGPPGEGRHPKLKFIAELPDPQHNRVEKVFSVRQFRIKHYRNPKSLGEMVAGIPTVYKYPQVAVVESQNEPILMVRTEQGVGGETYICSVTRDGHRSNFGVLLESDTDSFLRRVVEAVSRFQDGFNDRC